MRNVYDVGKSKLPIVEMWVEKDLVYPLARGRDLSKLTVASSGSIIIPHNSMGDPFSLEMMQSKYPKSLDYFQRFKKDLEKRSTYRLMGKGKPFYSVFKNSDYTFSQYKVAWQYISGEVSGKAHLNVGVIRSGGDKITIPNEKLMIIPAKSLKEGYYILGVLNSSIAKLIVASYSIESHISTDIMTTVEVPLYNPKDDIHNSISEKTKLLSKSIVSTAGAELLAQQRDIDKLVASLYQISSGELDEIRSDLRLLLNQKEDTVNEDEQENDAE